MKKVLTYCLFILLLSCKKEGETEYKKVELSGFHSVQLNDAFEVELIEGPSFTIEIEGLKSFVSETTFDVRDSVLHLSSDRAIKWNQPQGNITLLKITCPQLKFVSANETCRIRTNNPITTPEFGIVLGSKANQADIEVNNQVTYYWNNFPCGGKLTFRGKTNELKIWNTAIMSVDASALLTKKAFIENNSKGDCIINATENVFYKIEGEGNIIAYGQPKNLENRGISGSGKLILR